MSGVMGVSHFGIPISQDDGSVIIMAEAHEDIAAFRPVAIKPSRDVTDNDQDGNADNTGFAITATPATLAVGHYIGVPQEDVLSGKVGRFLVGGAGKMTVNNVTGAIVGGTSYLKVLDAGIIGQVDGATQTVNSFAFACESQDSATASEINVQLLGLPVQV